MKSVTGVFRTSALALRAGERAREVVGPRARIRVFLPTSAGGVLEADVLSDRYSPGPITLLGLLIGVAFLLLSGVVGGSWGLGLFGFAMALAMGVMMGEWLTGERHLSRGRALDKLGPLVRELEAGRAVVLAVVRDADRGAVMEALAESGGRVIDGLPGVKRRLPFGAKLSA